MTTSEHNRKYYLKHRERIRAKQKEYRQSHIEKAREYNRKWYQLHKTEYSLKYGGKYSYPEKKRAYANSPRGRECNLGRLYRFIDNHPEYNIEFLERMIRINERNVSLDRCFGDSNLNLYRIVEYA